MSNFNRADPSRFPTATFEAIPKQLAKAKEILPSPDDFILVPLNVKLPTLQQAM